jgi:putative ABC transport system ATP-binding protein
MSTPFIVCDGLNKVYQTGIIETTALADLDLEVELGEVLAVVGPSGSGKSTLLNILGGLDQPDSGVVLLGGRDIAHLPERELVAMRRHQVGFVFQSFGLLPRFSTYETVELALRMDSVPRAQRHARATECLTMVGLGQRMHHRPYELSGGQQQRLCIARAIANRPALILADEPTGELDNRTGQEILSLFRQIVVLVGTAVVVATHAPIVHDHASIVYELADGRLTRSAQPDEAQHG